MQLATTDRFERGSQNAQVAFPLMSWVERSRQVSRFFKLVLPQLNRKLQNLIVPSHSKSYHKRVTINQNHGFMLL